MAVPKAALLGANGQVGSEVALLLSEMGKLEPVAIGRSAYGLALLDKLGLICRVSPDLGTIKDIVGDCTVVVDMALPMSPDTRKTRQDIRKRAEAIVGAAPPGAKIIFASTMSVHRLDPDGPRHSIYGATKRFAERCYRQACKKRGASLFVLRLGQVHGAMQSATLGTLDAVRRAHRVSVPSIPSFTVFCSTIAEAIENIAEGKNEPGTYLLISSPEYNYAELAEWLACEAGTSLCIETRGAALSPSLKTRLVGRLKSALGRTAEHNKDLLVDIGYHLVPRRVEQARFDRHLQAARRAVADRARADTVPLFEQNRLPPGDRLPGLSDPRTSMPERHRALKARLSQLSDMIR